MWFHRYRAVAIAGLLLLTCVALFARQRQAESLPAGIAVAAEDIPSYVVLTEDMVSAVDPSSVWFEPHVSRRLMAYDRLIDEIRDGVAWMTIEPMETGARFTSLTIQPIEEVTFIEDHPYELMSVIVRRDLLDPNIDELGNCVDLAAMSVGAEGDWRTEMLARGVFLVELSPRPAADTIGKGPVKVTVFPLVEDAIQMIEVLTEDGFEPIVFASQMNCEVR